MVESSFPRDRILRFRAIAGKFPDEFFQGLRNAFADIDSAFSLNIKLSKVSRTFPPPA